MNERNNQAAEDVTTADTAATTECLSPNFGTAKDVLDKYTHCTLCGANLHFTHVTDFSRNITQETARCPECGVKARQVLHRLQ